MANNTNEAYTYEIRLSPYVLCDRHWADILLIRAYSVKKAYKIFPDNPTASILTDSRSDRQTEVIST